MKNLSNVNGYLKNAEKKAYEQNVPFKDVFKLTSRCNFKCKMCYVHLPMDKIAELGKERTKEQWIALAEDA